MNRINMRRLRQYLELYGFPERGVSYFIMEVGLHAANGEQQECRLRQLLSADILTPRIVEHIIRQSRSRTVSLETVSQRPLPTLPSPGPRPEAAGRPEPDEEFGNGSQLTLGSFLAGAEFVAALRRVSREDLGADEYDRQCVLCREQFTEDPVQLPCGHNFDSECLLPWLSQEHSNQNSCPICRRVLFERQLGDIIKADFAPLSIYQDYRAGGGPLRSDSEQVREQINYNRRHGVFVDWDLYEGFVSTGANLPPTNDSWDILDGDVLTPSEDRAMFEELRRRGAFAGRAMNRIFRSSGQLTDADIYDILRNSGASYCIDCKKWHEREGVARW